VRSGVKGKGDSCNRRRRSTTRSVWSVDIGRNEEREDGPLREEARGEDLWRGEGKTGGNRGGAGEGVEEKRSRGEGEEIWPMGGRKEEGRGVYGLRRQWQGSGKGAWVREEIDGGLVASDGEGGSDCGVRWEEERGEKIQRGGTKREKY